MGYWENKIAVVTGGAHGIGRCITEEFAKKGVHVIVIDIQEKNPFAGTFSEGQPSVEQPLVNQFGENGTIDYYRGDLAQKHILEEFSQKVIAEYGHVDFLIHNAPPLMKGLEQCSYEEFQNALSVGVTAPFYLTRLFAPYFGENASVINISSSRDRMSQPQTESYTAAKGAITALTHALAVSLSGKARVNSISPGWIDTEGMVYQGPDAYQQPVGRVGNPLDIANMVLFLCSDQAGFITGENICIDGGMTKQMIYHGDCGWSLE